jgi:putative flippase GtrA
MTRIKNLEGARDMADIALRSPPRSIKFVAIGISAIVGYAAVIAFHFPANRYLTFHDRRSGMVGEFARYLLVYACSGTAAYYLSGWLLEARIGPMWGYLLPIVSTAISYLLACIFIWKHSPGVTDAS